MSIPQFATQHLTHTITHLSGTVRNLLLGASLYYTVEREEYTHIPVIIIFPAIYSGYHAHQNKDAIVDWILATKKKLVG
jgi:hypothetical protein